MMRVKPGTLFDTGGYALSGKAYDLALSLTAKTTGEKIGSTVRSVVDAVDSGAAVNWLMGSLSSISTAAGEMLVDGSPLALDVLQALLAVRKAGGSTGPFDMFCYDWDTTRDWPCERYRFFVVQGGRILDAIVAFGDSGPGSFDREC
ncbi:MAG TPA: hypothetical protein VLT47_13225, partial [Anaeromyxobacteraceae bacterium]|nr:hypothetical protein [Anaeromyxobacteraceae bacterium]